MKNGKRREKRDKLRRKRKRHIVRNTFAITALLLIALWLSLPAVVEKAVLPELAKRCGIPCLAANVRHIGPSSFDVADLIIGESPGGGRLAFDSARIDYSPGFSGVTFDSVALSGAELDVEFTPEGVKFAGNTLEEWMGRFEAGGEKRENAGGANFFKVRNIRLEYSKVNLISGSMVWEIPAALKVRLPENLDSGYLVCEFSVGQGRDLTTGDFRLNTATGEGALNVKGGVNLSRILALADSAADLPLTGSLEAALSAELNLKTRELDGDFSLSTRRLRYGGTDANAAVRGGVTLKNDRLRLEFNEPHGLKLSFGDLELSSDRLTVAADLAADFHTAASGELEVVYGDLPKIRLSPELTADFGAGATIEGTAKAALENSGALETRFSFSSLPSPAATIYADNGGEPFAVEFAGVNAGLSGVRGEAGLLKLDAGWRVAARLESDGLRLSAGEVRVGTGAAQAHFELEPETPPLAALGIDGLFCNDLPIHVSRLSAMCELAASENPTRQPWSVSLSNGVELFGDVTATANGWRVSGTADYLDLFPSPPVLEAEVGVAQDPKLDARLKIPAFAIPVELIEPFYPDVSKWNLSGNLEVEANYSLSGGISSGAATATVTGAGVNNPEMELAADDISVRLNFPDLPNVHSSAMQEAKCGKIVYKGCEVNDLHALIQIRPDELFVEECSIRAFEGAVKVFCLHLPNDLGNIETDVHFERISLAAFINSFAFAYAEGEGHIYGTVPVRLGKNGFSVKNGYLYSEPGVEDKLSVGGLESIAAGSVELDITGEALKNFIYEWVRIDVDEEGENILLSATFKGRPENNLPFTFDSEKGGFVRVNYNGAHFQGITIIFNWRVPLNRLLELNNAYQKLTERMQK